MNIVSKAATPRRGFDLARFLPYLVPFVATFAGLTPALLAQTAEFDKYRVAVGLRDQGMIKLAVKECDEFLVQYRRSKFLADVRYVRALCLFKLKDYEKAQGAFREITQRHAGFKFGAESQFKMAECLMRLEKYAVAATEFQKFLRDFEDSYLEDTARFWLAESQFRADDFQSAERSYRVYLRRFPEGDHALESRRGLVWSLFRLERYPDCSREIQATLPKLRDRGEVAEMSYVQGECFYKTKDYKNALVAYQRVANDPVYGDDALAGRAYCLVEEGDKKAGAEAFAQLASRYSGSPLAPEARLRAGLLYVELGQAESARELLRPALAQGGTAAQEAHIALARVETESKNYAAAERHYRAAMDGPEDSIKAEARLGFADMLVAAGRANEAVKYYDMAADGAGGDYALASLVLTAFNGKRYDQVVSYGRRFKTRFASSEHLGDVAFALAETLFTRGEYPAAELEYELAARKKKELEATCAYRRAWCAYRQDDLVKAQAAFARFLRDHGSDGRRGEAYAVLGRIALDRGQADQAEQYYRQGLRDELGDYEDDCRIGLARALQERGLGTAAMEELASFEKRFPKSPLLPRALFDLGELRYAREDYDEASRAYRRVIEEFPGSTVFAYALHGEGWCRLKLADPKQAVQRAEQLEQANVKELRVPALELAAAAYRQADEPLKAAMAFRKLAQERGDDPNARVDAQIEAAKALVEAGQGAQATALFEDLLKNARSPYRRDEVLLEFGLGALEQEREQEARRAFQELIARHQNSPLRAEAAFQLGEFAYGESKFDEAIQSFSVVLQEGSNASDELVVFASYKRGWSHLKQENFAKAAPDFDRAAAVDPEGTLTGEALYLAGECLFRQGNYEKARERFTEVRRSFPGHAVSSRNLFRLGLAAGHMEDWPRCYESLRELLESHPDFKFATEAQLWVGRSMRSRGQNRAAVDYLAKAEGKAVGRIQAGMRLEAGRALLALEDHDGAIGKFSHVRFVYAYPEELAEATYLMGEALLGKGEQEAAEKAFTEVLQKYGKSPFAADARKQLQALKN